MFDLFGSNIDEGETVAPFFHYPELSAIKSNHVKRSFQLIICGESLDKFPLAREPGGARCDILMPYRVLVGELIAAQDDGIVLLREKLRFVRYEYIVALEFGENLPEYKVKRRRTLKPDVLEQLKHLSRFPQMLSPELLQKLLRAYGQNELLPTRG